MTSSEPSRTYARKVAIEWDTFGPQHVDRMNDVVRVFPNVVAVELFAQSDQYDWNWHPERAYEQITFSKARKSPLADGVMVIRRILGMRLKRGIGVWFLCNYERPYILITAWLLRLTGARVYVMQDSRFEDQPRTVLKEFLKSFFYAPYQGAISATTGTTDYLRFLGVKGPIADGYDTGSVKRIASLAQHEDRPFSERPFLFVARLLAQKNPTGFMRAYAAYVHKAGDKVRPLTMVGSGPEEAEVRRIATEAGVLQHVTFVPWASQPDVIRHMSGALYLCLPSVMEPFGNVVGEAACVGLPALLSDRIGARDLITRDFVSGFVLPVDDVETWSEAMLHVSSDEALWKRMRDGAFRASERFDGKHFTKAIVDLAGED